MGNLILLEPDTAREIGRLDVSREVGEIWGLEFEPAGRYLAVGGSNGVLAVAVERSGERVELGGGLRLALPGIYALGVHPTGRAIVALDRRSRLHRWDLVTAAPSRQISEAVGLTVYNAAFSPEGDHLRFIGFGDRLIDYDWQAERLSTLVEGLDAPFTPIPSPDGRWLALMQGRQMTLLSGATGAEAFRLPPEASGAWSYRWSPDGRQLALGFPDGSIRIWNLEAVRAALAPLGLDVPETALDAPAPRPEPAALAFLEKRQRTAGLEEAVASHAAAVRRGDEAGREAIERRVVQELGSDEAAWRDLARALAATAGSDESRAELANAAARTGPRFWLSLAMAVEGAGWGMTARTLGDRAEREYAAAVERRPEDLGTRHNHALALKRLGRDAQAIEELRAALNGDAPPITSRVLLARWLRQAGDLDEAAAELRKAAGSPALDTGGEEVRTLAEEAASLAEALEGRRGNDAGRDFFETAISAYERHVAGRARDVSCRARLAVLLREEADRRGEEERARQADRALACLMGGEPVDRDRAVIAISSTADERTAGGSPDRALRLYDWLIRELEPAARTRGLDAYNLACLIVRRARLLHGERREVEWSGAIEWLRRAVALGYRDLTLMGTDPDLAELRGRPDFAGLTMDLTFPADPFARPVTGVR
jgi:tetratricopeptide (TPR) repeat protein